ncbi:hypothetical protein [Pseudomonas sp. 8 R 14]|nr:hypothetical protein [Pseudomonas sp. 8 R 14]
MNPCRSELAREEPIGTAFVLNKLGDLWFFASKLAPTGGQKWYLTRKLAVSWVVLNAPESSIPYLFFQ